MGDGYTAPELGQSRLRADTTVVAITVILLSDRGDSSAPKLKSLKYSVS